jgi:hypothetical protein
VGVYAVTVFPFHFTDTGVELKLVLLGPVLDGVQHLLQHVCKLVDAVVQDVFVFVVVPQEVREDVHPVTNLICLGRRTRHHPLPDRTDDSLVRTAGFVFLVHACRCLSWGSALA